MLRARAREVRDDVAEIFPTHIAMNNAKEIATRDERDRMEVCAGSVRYSLRSYLTRVADMYVQFS
jgi:hypothetical protein